MRSLFGSLHPASRFEPVNRRPAGLFWGLLCVLGGLLQAASIAWPLTGWHLPGTTHGEPSGVWQIVSLALLALALQRSARPRTAASA
jgi:apolipoprotein N-acyltransferase